MLSWLNVLNHAEDVTARLQNSIAISLTIVVVLPELKQSDAVSKQITMNDALIIVLFFGLLLSSCTWPGSINSWFGFAELAKNGAAVNEPPHKIWNCTAVAGGALGEVNCVESDRKNPL